MVHVRNLRDDRYVFEAERYCMRGMRTGKIISLGDSVSVLIKSADLIKKQIDFELAGEFSNLSEEKSARRENPYAGKFSETSGKDDWNSPTKKTGRGDTRKKLGDEKKHSDKKNKGRKKH